MTRGNKDYFTQELQVYDLNHYDRTILFAALCAGKKVLHIGCVDSPIFDPNASLHLSLAQYCKQLDGYDTADYSVMRPHCTGALLDTFPAGEQYDLVLCPEVVEHVGNVSQFLSQLNTVNFGELLVTVPDAYSCAQRGHWEYGRNHMRETVHPDHVAWYSPYTLKNLIRRETDWVIKKLFFVNRISVGALCAKP